MRQASGAKERTSVSPSRCGFRLFKNTDIIMKQQSYWIISHPYVCMFFHRFIPNSLFLYVCLCVFAQPQHTNVCFWYLPPGIRYMEDKEERKKHLHKVCEPEIRSPSIISNKKKTPFAALFICPTSLVVTIQLDHHVSSLGTTWIKKIHMHMKVYFVNCVFKYHRGKGVTRSEAIQLAKVSGHWEGPTAAGGY